MSLFVDVCGSSYVHVSPPADTETLNLSQGPRPLVSLHQAAPSLRHPQQQLHSVLFFSQDPGGRAPPATPGPETPVRHIFTAPFLKT